MVTEIAEGKTWRNPEEARIIEELSDIQSSPLGQTPSPCFPDVKIAVKCNVTWTASYCSFAGSVSLGGTVRKIEEVPALFHLPEEV